MLTRNNLNSISYRGIGPYSIPSVTCTGFSAGFNFNEIDPLKTLNADTFVKEQIVNEQNDVMEGKSLMAKFLGHFNYSSLVSSSAFYNRY